MLIEDAAAIDVLCDAQEHVIQRHAGEASAVTANFNALTTDQQRQSVAFLASL